MGPTIPGNRLLLAELGRCGGVVLRRYPEMNGSIKPQRYFRT
jgi:hypothetical protein